jgi:hypothetical protein
LEQVVSGLVSGAVSRIRPSCDLRRQGGPQDRGFESRPHADLQASLQEVVADNVKADGFRSQVTLREASRLPMPFSSPLAHRRAAAWPPDLTYVFKTCERSRQRSTAMPS